MSVAKIPDPSEETLVPGEPSQHSIRGQPPPILITSKPCEKVNIGPVRWPICAQLTSRISITCIYCSDLEKGPRERRWRGRIVGKGAFGSIKALLLRIKHKHTEISSIGLLTLCHDCCTKLKLHDQFSQMGQILNFRALHNVSGKLVLGTSYKEVEELFSSQIIVLNGLLTTPFRTAGRDGQWKSWAIYNKLIQ
jgi:hypothetical protein